MKNYISLHTILCAFLLGASAMLINACSDWNEPETLKFDTIGPESQNPELYARYTESLKEYKKRPHYLVYARLDNAPKVSVSEKDFLRGMPDSLDYVVLTRPEQITDFDREDMKKVQADMDTRILWYADLFKDKDAINKAVSGMSAEGFDGISLSITRTNVPDATQLEKLFASAGPRSKSGKMLFFEGNPADLPTDLHNAFDYIVLNTSGLATAYDLVFQIDHARQFAGIPSSKLIISAAPEGKLTDIGKESIIGTAGYVVSAGPLAGLGIYNAGNDYYDPQANYKTIRAAIQLLNPSPIK